MGRLGYHQMRHLLRRRPLFLLPTIPPSLHLFSSSSSAIPATASASGDDPYSSLSQADLLSQTNLLIPRLCRSNHFRDAIRLLEAALTATAATTAPPPSLAVLADHLTAQPDMVDSMALINRLKHNPATQTFLLHVTRILIDSYLKKRRRKEAVTVFKWMLRPGSDCAPDREVFGVVISGLFGCHVGFEGLNALREMVRAGFDPGPELRVVVYRGLLRVAMVREAKALNGALECFGVDGGEGVEKAVKLLDDIISNWEE